MADLSKIKLNGTDYNLKDAYARGIIPSEETMANVLAMLTKYGLNTTTAYTAPTAETATADGTVLSS